MVFKVTYGQLKIICSAALIFLVSWIVMGHCVRQGPVSPGVNGTISVDISFLAPMNHPGTMEHFTIVSRPGNRPVKFSSRWISRNTVRLTVDEGRYPRGLRYYYSFRKAPALIPPFTVSGGGNFGASILPELVALEPAENVPTTGPVTLVFNTPLEPDSFYRSVSINTPGKFSSARSKCPESGKQYDDHSRWVFIPSARMKNGHKYRVSISPGLVSLGNNRLKVAVEKYFTTAPALVALDIFPKPMSPSVWLSRSIKIITNLPLKKADIKVSGIKGKVTLNGDTAVFEPGDLLLPARRYQVDALLESEHGEELKISYHFNTTNLGSQRWLDIKPGNPCVIKVMEGNIKLKEYDGWMSLAGDKIPRVTMYEEKRGSSLEYVPEHKNPVPYIRLNADIMLHPLPGAGEDNHQQLGLPRAYGCIYLSRDAINWIINNMPAKIMAVVH